MRISAVTVTYNNHAMLRDPLNDLLNQTRRPNEIFVIDNAGSDGTEFIFRDSSPGIRYIRLAANTGSAGGYYEGIMLAADVSNLIYTLDDDLRLNSDSIEQILNGITTLDRSSEHRIDAVRSVGKGHRDRVPSKLDLFPWRGTLLKTKSSWRSGSRERSFSCTVKTWNTCLGLQNTDTSVTGFIPVFASNAATANRN